MPESAEQQRQPDDELNEFEQDWIARFANIMAEGFGSAPSSGRKTPPRKVRSGVYRGVVSTLFPIYDEIADSPQHGSLFELGNEAAKQALWDSRVCPNQT